MTNSSLSPCTTRCEKPTPLASRSSCSGTMSSAGGSSAAWASGCPALPNCQRTPRPISTVMKTASIAPRRIRIVVVRRMAILPFYASSRVPSGGDGIPPKKFVFNGLHHASRSLQVVGSGTNPEALTEALQAARPWTKFRPSRHPRLRPFAHRSAVTTGARGSCPTRLIPESRKALRRAPCARPSSRPPPAPSVP